MIQLVLLHSLARVFPDRELPLSCKKTKGSMLKNEVYSFQLAYCGGEGCGNIGVQVKLDHDLGKAVSWRAVECVPCDFTMYPHYHEGLEHPEPGLFPDILRPGVRPLWVLENQWRSLWITVDGSKKSVKPGKHKITLELTDGKISERAVFTLDVLDKKLPKQSLICTNWIHTDCLCHYYRTEFNSEEY